MKLYNRVIAMALALIMTFAVLPLGIFASEQPAIKVETETEKVPGTDSATTKVVVKVNAAKLAEILNTTGISKDFLTQLKDSISVDLGSLLDLMSVEEIFKIFPIEDFIGENGAIDLGAIVSELGSNIGLYIDLGALLGGLTEEQIKTLVAAEDALPIVLDYYENVDPNGLSGLLKELMTAGGEDADGDGVPDNSPVRVHQLANAKFWNKNCFTDAIHSVDLGKYIDDHTVSLDDMIHYWPKTEDDKFDISFLQLGKNPVTGEESDFDLHAFLEDAHAANIDIAQYFLINDLFNNAHDLAIIKDVIVADRNSYLTAAGLAKIEMWAENAANGALGDAIEAVIGEDIKAIVETNVDWENDLDKDALKTYLGIALGDETDDELALKLDDDAVVEDIKAQAKLNPKQFLTAQAYDKLYDLVYPTVEDRVFNELYDEFLDTVLTEENIATLTVDDIDLIALTDATKNDVNYYQYIKLDNFIRDEMNFFVEYREDFLTAKGLDKIYHSVDFISIALEVIGIDTIIRTEGLDVVLSWVDMAKVLEAMENAEDPAERDIAQYVNTSLAIDVIGVDKLLTIIEKSGTDITSLVDINALIEAVGIDAIMAQISLDEVRELANLNSVKSALPILITRIAGRFLYNIDEITVGSGKDKTVIAAEDPNSFAGELVFDVEALMSAIIKMVPTLDDLATLENDVLFSTGIGFTYLQDPDPSLSINQGMVDYPDPVTKDFVLEVVLEGGTDQIRAVASKLKALIDSFIRVGLNGGIVEVELTIPEMIAQLYGKVLASDKLPDAIKDKILEAPTTSGNDVVGLVNSLTIGELIQIIEKLDTDALYERFMALEYTQKLFALVNERTGKDLSDLTINELVALVDSAIDKAGENAKIATIYNIINDKIGARFGIDVTTVLENKDFTNLTDRVVAQRDQLEWALVKIQNFVTLIGEKLESFSYTLMNATLGDLYVGNGAFNIGAATDVTIPVGEAMERVLEKLMSRFNLNEDFLDYATKFFPADVESTVGFDLTVKFEDLYRVTYHDANSDKLFEAFLPYGAKLSLFDNYIPEGVVMDGWRLIDGTVVTDVTGDMDVYPNLVELGEDYVYIMFVDGNGDIVAKLTKVKGYAITAYDVEQIGTFTKAADSGYEYIWQWTQSGWTLDGNAVNPVGYVVNESVTFAPSFAKTYFDPIYGPVTTPVEDGYVIESDELLFEADTDKIVISEMLINHAMKDSAIAITLKGNGVEIKIDNATLRQMRDLGDQVAISYTKNTTSFSAGYYTQDNSVLFAIDFLCGDKVDTLKSYTALTEEAGFAGEVLVKVPFEKTATADAVHVYYITDGVRNAIDATVSADSISIAIKNSDAFIVANEYRFTASFESIEPGDMAAIVGSVDVDGQYYPAGATVVFKPTVENYLIYGVTITNEGFTGTLTDNSDGTWTVSAMPAETLNVLVQVEYATYYVIFTVEGEEYLRVPVKNYNKLVLPDSYVDPTKANDEYDVYKLIYTFDSWKDANGDKVDLANVTINGADIYLTAEFTSVTYNLIVFNYIDANGAVAVEKIWMLDGQKLTDNEEYVAFAATIPTRLVVAVDGLQRDTYTFNNTWKATDFADASAIVSARELVLEAGYDDAVEYLITFGYLDANSESALKTIWFAAGDKLTDNDEYVAFANAIENRIVTVDGVRTTYSFNHTWKLGGAFKKAEEITVARGLVLAEAGWNTDLVEYKVVFMNEGVEFYAMWVDANGTIAADDEFAGLTTPEKAAPTDINKYLHVYTFDFWTLNDKAFALDSEKITKKITLDAHYYDDYFIHDDELGNENDKIKIYFDGEDLVVEYTNPDIVNGIKLTLPEQIKDYVADHANAKWTLKVNNADGTSYELLVVSQEVLGKLYENAALVAFAYQKPEMTPEMIFNKLYNKDNSTLFAFEFYCDGNEFEGEFNGGVRVQIPVVGIVDATGNSRTSVYYVGTNLEKVEATVNTTNNNYMVFSPDHFSQYLVANEYKLTYGASHGDDKISSLTEKPAISAKLEGVTNGGFYPAGAKFIDILAIVTKGYYTSALNSSELTATSTTEGYKTTWSFVMPAKAATLDVVLMPREYTVTFNVKDADGVYQELVAQRITYTVHDLLLDADCVKNAYNAAIEAIIAAGVSAPEYYVTNGWYGFDETMPDAEAILAGNADLKDMNVFLTYQAIEYTIEFVDPTDAENPVKDQITVTIESDKSEFIINLPNKLGYVAVLDSVWEKSMEELIDMMVDGKLQIEITYELRSYDIFFDSTMAEVISRVEGKGEFGELISFLPIDKAHLSSSFKVYNEKGEVIEAVTFNEESGKYEFTMPAGAVTIVVTYEATKTVPYIIISNGIETQGMAILGEMITFEVRLSNGYRLASISDNCKLIDVKTDGTDYVLVYAFEAVVADTPVSASYAVEEVVYDNVNIFNGSIYDGAEDPYTESGDVTFGGWFTSGLGGLSFAKYEVDTATSLVWLWILLAVIVLIALIVVLYKLYVGGKLKSNFVLRFVAWIVSGFFAVCVFVATVGLFIVSVFGKKESDYIHLTDNFVDDENNGFEEAKEASEEEAANENAAEDEEA